MRRQQVSHQEHAAEQRESLATPEEKDVRHVPSGFRRGAAVRFEAPSAAPDPDRLVVAGAIRRIGQHPLSRVEDVPCA